jgi:hypothetical protein
MPLKRREAKVEKRAKEAVNARLDCRCCRRDSGGGAVKEYQNEKTLATESREEGGGRRKLQLTS